MSTVGAEGKGKHKITPMLEQYLRAKEENPGALLFFRLGDFYELFFEDAETAANVLDITLTTRSKKDEVPIPMCGVPHHAVQTYVSKLLAEGFKVSLCDQVGEPAPGKKLVERAVVRVMTPGTVTEEEYLDPKQASYLLSVFRDGTAFAIAWIDLSTGDVCHAQRHDAARMRDLLLQLAPREVLVAADDDELVALVEAAIPTVMISRVERVRFDAQAGHRWATDAGSGGGALDDGVAGALAGALWYLERTHRSSLDHLRGARALDAAPTMVVDEATRRNLELFVTTRGEKKGSLLSVIDQTSTPMGGRRLREWILAPLTDIAAIGERLDAVEILARQPTRRSDIRRALGSIGDLERLTSRLAARRVHARDLTGLAAALETALQVRTRIESDDPAGLRSAAQQIDDLPEIRDQISRTIDPEAPLKPRPGTLILKGCNAEVDELRDIALNGKQTLVQLEAREREQTGIGSLKIKYNNVFGYYIEVTKANLGSVPEHYRRKQTTANAERFVTDEIESYEAKVLGAEEKLASLEARLFDELVDAVAARHVALSATADGLARIDVAAALAHVADERAYVRPQMHGGRAIRIVEGRHPVVEAMAGRIGFVANDCLLDPESRQILVLTGPNMAGKSTYLRQVALVVLLAQIGSFVPASEAEIGVVDRLFTRIGAADNLAGGESTFMVEMKETASIVCNLTERSLAILDEIGRGTSTFDGISIAWAVVEHLHDAESRPLVLFATHYHELTDLNRSRERAHNLSVAVREWKGDVLFLRRVIDGPASQSYGIQVAGLAGVPDTIVARAKQILANLEKNELTASGEPALADEPEGGGQKQMALFAASDDGLRRDLAAVELESMTPLESMNLLHDLRRRARERS